MVAIIITNGNKGILKNMIVNRIHMTVYLMICKNTVITKDKGIPIIMSKKSVRYFIMFHTFTSNTNGSVGLT